MGNKVRLKDILTEANRRQLLDKSKHSDSYKDPARGNRYTRRTKSRIAASVRDYNSLDMNALFKGDILDFVIPVHGETSDYEVKITFEHVLSAIQDEIKRNNNKLEFKCILRALIKVFNSEDVYVSCSCPDFKYSGNAYWATVGRYNSGTPQTNNGKGIRNPHDTKGAGCKHINLCLANVDWLMKISSVINNYIYFARDNMENNYASYIFPKLFGMDYNKAIQLTLNDFDDKGNLKPDLDSDPKIINLANQLGRRRTQYKKAPQPSVNPRYQRPKKEEPESNALGLEFENDNPAEEKSIEPDENI